MSTPQLEISMDIIGLDFDKLEAEFEKAIDEGMDKLAKEIEKTWRDKAAATLNTSKDKYLEALTVERVGKDVIKATLTGFVAVGIEEGHEAYDMKPGLLGSGLAKVIPIGKGAGGSISFRKINASTKGWMHPGWQAKKIHEQVQKEIDERLKMEIFEPIISRISV
jgi:hypothetical protein